MTLVSEQSQCPLCGKRVGDRPIFATWGVFGWPDLMRYCDAAMHWECYEAWPHRERFAESYVRFSVESTKGNPYWGESHLDDDVFVSVSPSSHEVQVMPMVTGSRIRVGFADWKLWISNLDYATRGQRDLERAAIAKVLPRLQEKFPEPDMLVQAIDWVEKDRIQRSLQLETERAEQERLEAIRPHNEACRRIAEQKPACPYCDSAENLEFLNKSPERKSYFICRVCGRSSRPEEFAAQGPPDWVRN